MGYEPIENYGVVGDLHTVALVSMQGSVDFMCYPHFDSPTIFAALLDDTKGGRFKISPLLEEVRCKQMYLPDSNVLLTRFLSSSGIGEILDFMPLDGLHYAHRLVRLVKGIHRETPFRMLFAPRFNYARSSHCVERRQGEFVFLSEGPDRTALRFASTIPVELRDGDLHAEFRLGPGATAVFVLEEARAGAEALPVSPDQVWESLNATVNYWHDWIGRSTYKGRWREMVNRSALTLKLLTSVPHGSIVAAPTFGLPELIGGERNWDYRYTWIRDASFTLYALMRLGYVGEAQAFMRWIERICGQLNSDGSLQIMYGIDGRPTLTEEILPHLEGYRKSAPVRIGNAAYNQLQLDIYGELLDSVYLYNQFGEPISYDFWMNLLRLVDWVCHHWRLPDEGIWEVRGGRQEFLYSRVMCWVTLDRAIRLAQQNNFPGPLPFWQKVREQIHRDISDDFWDHELQAFVQHKGAKAVDASSLLMPLVRFINPNDSRWFFTLSRIERSLVEDSLVYRYRVEEGAADGLRGGEGTFTMCSFWYVECISRSGEVDRARFLFEKALTYSNHLGLYGEELGPCGEHLGNFPQAFTHLALISAAYNLNQKLSERSVAR